MKKTILNTAVVVLPLLAGCAVAPLADTGSVGLAGAVTSCKIGAGVRVEDDGATLIFDGISEAEAEIVGLMERTTTGYETYRDVEVPVFGGGTIRVEETVKTGTMADYAKTVSLLLMKPGGLDDGESARVYWNAVRWLAVHKPEHVDNIGFACLLTELGAPMRVTEKLGQTRAIDGRQTDSWDQYTVEWTYHPDNGLDGMIYSR